MKTKNQGYRNQGRGIVLVNQITDKIKTSREKYLIKLFTEYKSVEFYEKCEFIENGGMVFDNVLLTGVAASANR